MFLARGLTYASQVPEGALAATQFDANRSPSLRTDACGWSTTYTADVLGRIVGQVYLDGERVTQTFDADGHLVSTADVTGITTLSYDLDGRQVGVVNGIGKALTYTLDQLGYRLMLVDPDGRAGTYLWDAEDHLVVLVNGFGETTTLGYDALGRETRRALANGIASSRQYDAAGREAVILHAKSDGTPLAIYTAAATSHVSRNALLLIAT